MVEHLIFSFVTLEINDPHQQQPIEEGRRSFDEEEPCLDLKSHKKLSPLRATITYEIHKKTNLVRNVQRKI